ncbi:MAG: RNA 3'-terminal phosphate cyclase [Candidatus Omnitrophica bacterium]|nr:RNA 3'-terminal phosphate cyclase [Candidatus Omnitrophota bacterium]
MQSLLEIAGDYLEGGGQILRTALALSCILQRPVRIYNIRAKRPNPGLQAQHFAVIRALRELTSAKVEGFFLGSKEIKFHPSKINSLSLDIDIQTAGSIGLFLQALIPVGVFSEEGILLNIKGGTTGKSAIPIEYYSAVIIPTLKKIGIMMELELIKRGYYPKGGGQVKVRVFPKKEFKELNLTQQGVPQEIQGISHAHKELKRKDVSERQRDALVKVLSENFNCPIRIECEYSQASSLGSGVVVWLKTDTEAILGADAMGEIKKPAEEVGKEAGLKLIEEFRSKAVVDRHLADNLILWLAFCRGRFKTSQISLHTQTNIWLVENFLGIKFKIEDNLIQLNLS